jgi:hypothetical protein
MLWGFLLDNQIRFAKSAALITTGLLTVVFTWRAFLGWSSYFNGASDKLLPSTLITIMVIGSLVLLPNFAAKKKN